MCGKVIEVLRNVPFVPVAAIVIWIMIMNSCPNKGPDQTQLQWEESCLSRGGVVLPVDYGDIGFKCVAP